MLISVCVLAKDAAHSLPAALTSALELGDEVIIRVDKSSQDETLSVANEWHQKHPDKIRIFEYDFVHFGSARNGLVHEAKSEWIFMLDADETIDSQDIKIIRTILIRGLGKIIYSFPRKNWVDLERTAFQAKYYPDRQFRLFAGGGTINYGDQHVHEVPQGTAKIPFPDASVHINHFCFAFRTHQDWHDVNQFYRKLGSQLKDVNPDGQIPNCSTD